MTDLNRISLRISGQTFVRCPETENWFDQFYDLGTACRAEELDLQAAQRRFGMLRGSTDWVADHFFKCGYYGRTSWG